MTTNEQRLNHNNIKKAQAIVIISMLMYLGVIFFTPDFEAMASEKAWDELSYSDYVIVSNFMDAYTSYIDYKANIVDTSCIILFWIMVLGILYQTHIIFSIKFEKEDKKDA